MSSKPQLASDILAIDIGNTHMRAELVVGAEKSEECSWDYIDPHFFRAWLLATAVNCSQRQGSQPPIYIASVNPARCDEALKVVAEAGFLSVHVATWRDPWPMEIDVESPQSLGMDRLANVAGLVALGMRSGIVVDLGTAITIDVLDAGSFRGGMIAPGLTLQAQALRDHTAVLPLVDPKKQVTAVGRSTEDAIVAGITNIALEGASTMARRLADQLGEGVPILCTGGWGRRLVGRLEGVRYEPGLTFLGLRALAARCT